jgi:CRP-like cAMP-binding protein
MRTAPRAGRDIVGRETELAALQRFLDAGSQPRALVLTGGPGHSFGEMALVAEGLRRSATVAALEEAETFAVYLEALYISA